MILHQEKIQRIGALDGLRAVAALGVVWVHVWSFFGNPLSGGRIDWMRVISVFGSGVDFFFVISGFCMYLMNAGIEMSGNNFTAFIRKRFLRIAPAYYMSVLVYVLAGFYYSGVFAGIGNIASHLLFLNNFTGNNISGPLWSIATEWQFYMILPLVMLLIPRFGFWPTMILCIAVSQSFNVMMYTGLLPSASWDAQVPIRFLQFAIGMITCHLYLDRKALPKLLGGYFGIVFFFMIVFCGRMLKSTEVMEGFGSWGLLLASLSNLVLTGGFAGLLFHVITRRSWLQRILMSRPVRFLGRISYSIYLWHSLCITLLAGILLKLKAGIWNVPLGFLLLLLVCVPLSYFSYRFLEAFYFERQRRGRMIAKSPAG